MQTVRRLLALLVVAALAWAGWRFFQGNQAEVPVDLPGLATQLVPLWAALAAAFAAGAAVAFLLLLVPLARGRLVARRYRREVGGLEAEIHQLRNLPLAAEGSPAAGAERGHRLDRDA